MYVYSFVDLLAYYDVELQAQISKFCVFYVHILRPYRVLA